MKALQLDLTSNYSKEILPFILKNAGTYENPIFKRAIKFLKDWNNIESIDSEGTLNISLYIKPNYTKYILR